MFRRTDLLRVRGIPDALAQQQQAGRVGLAQQRAHLLQPRRQVFGLVLVKLSPLAAHRAGNPQQYHQLLAQATNGAGTLAPAVAFEPGVFALAIDGHDTPQALQQAFARLVFATQHGTGRLQAVLPGLAGLPAQLLFDAHGPQQRTAGGGTEDPQADLGAACDGLVEHLQRMVDGRQGDDRGGVAGQHEGIGPGGAQLGGSGSAQGQPQGQGKQEQAGAWANRPMNSTDMSVPTSVPASRARPFCTTMPDSGWATMKAVINAQAGCSRPQRIASHRARPPPSRVLMANLTARLLGRTGPGG